MKKSFITSGPEPIATFDNRHLVKNAKRNKNLLKFMFQLCRGQLFSIQ